MHWLYPIGGSWFIVILWWIIIVTVVVVITKLTSPRQGIQFKEDSAIEILKKRYARGEISKEEFEEKKKDLV